MKNQNILKVIVLGMLVTTGGIYAAETEEKREVQVVESGLRATALSFFIGLGLTAGYGNKINTHLVGASASIAGNILFGELMFKDRNYWAQGAGILFGYIAGSVVGDQLQNLRYS